MGENRRQFARANVTWPIVVLTNHGTMVGETRNISVDGAFVYCPEPLRKRDKLRLFIMAPNRRPLDLPVVVTWANPHGSEGDLPPRGMGVRFERISQADQDFIASVVAGYVQKNDIDWRREESSD